MKFFTTLLAVSIASNIDYTYSTSILTSWFMLTKFRLLSEYGNHFLTKTE